MRYPQTFPSRLQKPSRKALTLTCLLALAGIGCAADVTGASDADGGIGVAQAELEESCSSILTQGIYDDYAFSKSGSSAFAMAKSFCDEVKKGGGGGGGISIGLPDIGISLTGSGSSSSWTKYCSSFSTSANSNESTSLITHNVNPDIVDAWLQCMTAGRDGGLACYQKPGQNIIGIELEEIANTGDLTRTTLTPTNITIQNPSDAKPRLYQGDTGLAYTFVDEMKDGTFLLNGKTEIGSYAQSCSVVVKSDKKIRAEVGKTWVDLGAKWSAIGAAIDAINANTTRDIFEKRVYDVAIIKYWDAAVHASDCASNLSSCAAPPVAADYNYSYKMPRIACKSIFGEKQYQPLFTYGRNALVNTPADDVAVVRKWQRSYADAKANCFGTLYISG